MWSRYFRYLFESPNDGLLHTGCIYDKLEGRTTNFIYMAGSHAGKVMPKASQNLEVEMEDIPKVIDILVIGGWTSSCVRKLIEIVQNREVKIAVLPYLAPVQRLVLAGIDGEGGRDFSRFLQDPCRFLVGAGVPDIRFLYGNGTDICRKTEDLEDGYYFEPVDDDILRLVQKMEGEQMPMVVKAGYIVKNGWLFYFGVYGINLMALYRFTRDYFSRIENFCETCASPAEDYTAQIQRLVLEYGHKFGNLPAATIVMYEDLLDASPKRNDSFMSQTEFARRGCREARDMPRDGRQNCLIRTVYRKDYDVMQRHKDREENKFQFGMLLLGNVDLNRYFPRIAERFWLVRSRIRVITIPNCGNRLDWNRRILEFPMPRDRIYWICSRHKTTSAEVVKDIALSSPGNRFLVLSEVMGVCFSGYVVSRENRLEY